MKKGRIILLTFMFALILSMVSLSACNGKDKYANETSPLVIATGELDGVFSPFFSTSAYDSQVVGMTQLGMLSIDKEGLTDYGDDVATVVRYASETPVDTRDDDQKRQEDIRYEDDYYTTYELVLKNGIKFADKEELTYKDVLFNLYLYLDPIYNGSNTLYSTDIFGLEAYRTQSYSESSASFDETINLEARERVRNFLRLFDTVPGLNIPNETELRSDFAYLKEEFRKELNSDWSMFSASLEDLQKEYTSIADGKKLVTEVWQAFLVGWNAVTVTRDENTKHSTDPNKIISIDFSVQKKEIDEIRSKYKKESKSEIERRIKEYCVNLVYANYFGLDEESDAVFKVKSKDFIYGTSTGSDYFLYISNQIRSRELGDRGNTVPNIEGIKIFQRKSGEVFVDNIKGKTPQTITLDEDHWVLSIKIYGVDPKALTNFGFTVAPMHYYSNPSVSTKNTYNENMGYKGFSIENNHFGFPFANVNYMNDVIKGVSGLPMGAGTYMPSTSQKEENFSKVKALGTNDGFYDSNIVYYVRNPYFYTVDKSKTEKIHNAKIKYVRLAVTNATRLLDAVATDTVHFADPTAKKETMAEINKGVDTMKSIKTLTNGYGYIGINAKFVPDIDIRRAIMHAMNIAEVKSYYPTELVENIYRPISKASWAYPETVTAPYYNSNKDNRFDETEAKKHIAAYVASAGYTSMNNDGVYTKGGHKLEYTFTIAGGNSDHPAYLTMLKASQLLNTCGFKTKVTTNPFALRDLSSGQLTVWAAAWSSAIDPDMYQIYHKDSKATSIIAWGYPTILGLNGETRNESQGEERDIIDELSLLIDAARRVTSQEERKPIYEDALKLVMDLAVELPTYQRYDVSVYKSKIIDESTILSEKECSPYMGPLARIWEVSFANQ